MNTKKYYMVYLSYGCCCGESEEPILITKNEETAKQVVEMLYNFKRITEECVDKYHEISEKITKEIKETDNNWDRYNDRIQKELNLLIHFCFGRNWGNYFFSIDNNDYNYREIYVPV